ncbi:biotin carboxylase N-terminal domain-containing protein [Sporichthya sp.]|uniref:acetyl/propionyl/methylcrotonyl-CoA carboxylase subunit alpha n=1 Tax=Sporichthya sp. TaxID=65475 RepID=UPI00179FF36F|nr:ATP-grasp domain-containing protein [Sporichthya sp.]
MRSVLVANRGEIAVRVLRAARDAGMRGIAVHAPDEAAALHVRRADEAHEIPGYLDIDAIVAVARAAGAQAVHPGYGFLAENDEFAAAVLDAGLIWIGPPPSVIRELGDKVTARRIAKVAGAPLAPGTESPVADAAEIEAFAAEHGLPLVIKAAFGGGGRGMKVVRTIEEIPAAFESATREAVTAFGRGECFVERFLEAARHVEAQVLADDADQVVVVGTRDCSVQRRNQKLIEEAPAPFLPDAVRARIHSSARAICRAAGYRGAGTVEYLVGADDTISFLEVNTRLQVEHPVTEETTGVDLVAEQFRLAAGARLLSEDDVPSHGHAIEFRLVAEDPAQGFLPAPGTVTALSVPTGPGVRLDAGLEAGDPVEGRYDSMFAKLIVSGPDRAATLRRAGRVLEETSIEGVPTPLGAYRLIVRHLDFATEPFRVHNRWVENDFDAGEAAVVDSGSVMVRIGRRVMPVPVPGLSVLGERADTIRVESASLRTQAGTADTGPAVLAPMQGTIVAVAVKDGDTVEVGDLIAVCEAMKMENPVRAHRAGIITGLAVAVGDGVTHHAVLCTIA